MKTAVEWLVEQMTQGDFIALPKREWIKQAKEMEKEQHEKTWAEGMFCETGDRQAFIEYYNETFKSE
jgi:hypothetical protein